MLLLLGTVAMASCSQEEVLEPQVPSGGTTFTLTLPQANLVETRGTVEGTENENNINNLWLLGFNSAGTQLLYVKEFKASASDFTYGTDKKTATVTFAIANGTYKFVAVANHALSSAISELTLPATYSIATLASALTETKTAKWTLTSTGGYIPMWGEVTATISTGMTDPVEVDMTRMLARIDVSTALSNFKIKSVSLYNYNTKGYVIPAGLTGGYVTAVTNHGNINLGKNTTTAHTATSSDGKKAGALYTFEAAKVAEFPAYSATEAWDDWTNANKLLWQGNPCLIVTGQYSPDNGTTWETESHYRIDFIQQKADITGGTAQKWLDLLRNHTYKVSINSVNGSGYASATLAKTYAPVNLDASTYVVTGGEKEQLAWDGPYYLLVEKKEFDLPLEGGAETMKIKTNYPSGWKGELFADADCTTPLASNRLSAAPLQSTTTVLTDQTLTLTPSFFWGCEEAAHLKFTAGRMTQVMKINLKTPFGSNSYMVDPSRSAIRIPISRMFYAMGLGSSVSRPTNTGLLPENWAPETDRSKLKAEIFWSDRTPLNGASAVVNSTAYNDTTGEIVVTPGSGQGNAGIMLYIDTNSNSAYDSGEKIIWSWHIWNLSDSYYPYDSQGTAYASGMAKVWMDRNLGATYNHYSGTYEPHRIAGLMYQWGRKDPLPSISDWNNSEAPVVDFVDYFHYRYSTVSFIESAYVTVSNNLQNSVKNPLTKFTTREDIGDWFTDWNKNYKNPGLWGGNDGDVPKSAGGKSVYDPCPVGYKVPRGDAWAWDSDLSKWTDSEYGRTNDLFGGYYPAAGHRFAMPSPLGMPCLSTVGTQGLYFTASAVLDSYFGYFPQALRIYKSGGTVMEIAEIDAANGCPIRCVRE